MSNNTKTYTELDKTVVLQRPITAGERRVEELKFPEDPEFGLLEALDKADGNMARMFHIIAAATGEHITVIRKLKPIDISLVLELAQALMGELMPTNLLPQT